MRKYSQFSSISLTVPIDSAGNLKADQMQYTPGTGGEIVVVRAYYHWPVYLNKLGNDLSDVSSGKHLLAATAAFRNEPFPW